MNRSFRVRIIVVATFAVISVAFSWPLILHLDDAFTGPPSGDTGVYVWNQWVFHHEVIDQHSLPYVTNQLFGSRHRANLSLHNYTTLQNLIALPLIRPLGVVTTFNVVYLLMVIWTAYAAFALAFQLTGRLPESWLGGVMFAWSPVLVTRGMGHFSLAAAAPLALFLLLLVRSLPRPRLRDAAALGAAVALAFTTDPYYAVYCVLIAVGLVIGGLVTVDRLPNQSRPEKLRRALDVLLFCLGGVVLAILVRGGWNFTFLGRPIYARTVYTPMLTLTIVALLRIGLHYRTRVTRVTRTDVWQWTRILAVSATVLVFLLWPALVAMAQRALDGDWDAPRIFWRSSPPGVDLVTWFIPNPNHPLAPAALAARLATSPDDYLENVASVSWVGLGILIVAVLKGWKAPRAWLAFTLLAGLLACGPFLIVNGANTHIPGPWAILRYLPIVGLARTPARLSIPAALGFAMLSVMALSWLTARYPRHRQAVIASVTVLLLFELIPAPRPLYSAAIPALYRHVAAAPANAVVLQLPFGYRDGRSNRGDFSALSQYFQTAHGKILMGGYLSRVPRRRFAEAERDPVLNALILLSENHDLSAEQRQALLDRGLEMIRAENVRFVVIDRSRARGDLVSTAVQAFHLRVVESDERFDLLEPQDVVGASPGPPTSTLRFSGFPSPTATQQIPSAP